MSLSPPQLMLARCALGLPNARKRSYRNRYHASAGTVRHRQWEDMVLRGYAMVLRAPDSGSRADEFTLTRAGADQALQAGEQLCAKDFPPISAH